MSMMQMTFYTSMENIISFMESVSRIQIPMEPAVPYPALLHQIWQRVIIYVRLWKRRKNIYQVRCQPCLTWEGEAVPWIMDIF